MIFITNRYLDAVEVSFKNDLQHIGSLKMGFTTICPKLSVIIALDDRPLCLDNYFDILTNQTLSPEKYEIIICSTCEKSQSSLIEAYGKFNLVKSQQFKIILVNNKSGGRAKSLNKALGLAAAPLILFLADDFIPESQHFESHLNFHESNKQINYVGVALGLLPKIYHNPFSVWLEKSGSLFGIPFSKEVSSIPENYFYIGNSSIKRDFIDGTTYFDEVFPYNSCDDWELGLRLSALGMKSFFVSNASATHMHNITLAERCSSVILAGESAAIFKQKYSAIHREHKIRKIPLWIHEIICVVYNLRYKMINKQKYLESYWNAKLRLSFNIGFKRKECQLNKLQA